MLCIVSCLAKSDVKSIRETVTEPHKDYLNGKFKEGVLLLSGPLLTDDGTKVIGSYFLTNVNSIDEAKAFSAAEPYTKAGMFSSVTITRMRKGRVNAAGLEAAS